MEIKKCRKFGDLILKILTLVRFLKTKNSPNSYKIMYESLHGIEDALSHNAKLRYILCLNFQFLITFLKILLVYLQKRHNTNKKAKLKYV